MNPEYILLGGLAIFDMLLLGAIVYIIVKFT